MVFEDLEPLIGYFFLPCWPYVFGLILRKGNSSSNGWFIPSFPFCGEKSNPESSIRGYVDEQKRGVNGVYGVNDEIVITSKSVKSIWFLSFFQFCNVKG